MTFSAVTETPANYQWHHRHSTVFHDLRAYDNELVALSYAWQLAQKTFVTATATLKFERNRHVPMNRLPTEILRWVFRNATQTEDNVPNLLRISQVCAHWRDIMLHDFEQWTSINLDRDDSNLAELFRRRSGRLPLRLSYAGTHRREPMHCIYNIHCSADR